MHFCIQNWFGTPMFIFNIIVFFLEHGDYGGDPEGGKRADWEVPEEPAV